MASFSYPKEPAPMVTHGLLYVNPYVIHWDNY
nr:MAG TPA: hypothetical protein [Caudoviricetes sp.]